MERIFEFCGRPDVFRDNPVFATFQGRTKHIDQLYELLAQFSLERSTEEWVQLLQDLDVPHARLNRLEDLQDDPQLKASGLFQRQEHPHAGPYYAVRSPMKFSKTPMSIRRHPPCSANIPQNFVPSCEPGEAAE